MSDQVLNEEPLQFGQGRRLFGILTRPSVSPGRPDLPVFVFLNAGFLHRVGPHRLYVHLARGLAELGFSSFRVDLAGTGDSPRRQQDVTHPQSVAADIEEISDVLRSHLGPLPLVLGGLCSAAHDAVRIAPGEPRVIGMILLDPICFRDHGFRVRALMLKYRNPGRYFGWLRRRFNAFTRSRQEQEDDHTLGSLNSLDNSVREQLRAAWGVPNLHQLRAAFQSIRERKGRVISVFTQSALERYNQLGQMGRVVGVEGYQQFCTELFWPQVEHTFTLELHRRRLIDEIKTWARGYLVHRWVPTVDTPPSSRPAASADDIVAVQNPGGGE